MEKKRNKSSGLDPRSSPSHQPTTPQNGPNAKFDYPEKFTPPPAQSTLDLKISPELRAIETELSLALDADSPGASAGERLINDLVSRQMVIMKILLDAEEQLGARLMLLLDQPQLVLVVLRILKETISTSNALGRRVETALVVASTLRAQRRFVGVKNGGAGES